MARPNRQGADYFPLDVHLDDKFKFVEIKCGLEGFAILIKILQKIYSYGYWYKWSDDEALLFSGEVRADLDKVQEVVTESLNREIFDKKLFDQYNILTSKGIQKRYKEIVRRRKDVEVVEDYLLIDNNFGVNDSKNDNNEVNDGINISKSKRDDGKSTQSKVKESKVNGNEDDSSNAFTFFEENFGFLAPFISENIQHWINELSEELVIESMKIAISKGKRNFKFCEGILRDWYGKGLKTVKHVEQVERSPNKFRSKKSNVEKIEEYFAKAEVRQ